MTGTTQGVRAATTAATRAWWCAVMCSIAAASCGGSTPQIRAKPAPIRLEITSGKDTNHGGPLYVVVRKLDQAGFLAEDYDAIADRLFGEPRDPSVLRKAIVRPGEATTVEADRELADGEILGVYFLFSVPDDHWRLAIGDKRIQRVKITLGASGIASAEQQ
jgi:predicted component of type VI protein secretion system